MRRIEADHDLAEALDELRRSDARLAPIAEAAGPLALRRRPRGFEGLAAIVTAQQISDRAAAAIWTRLRASAEPFTPETFLTLSEADLRSAGLSRPKVRTLRSLAEACRSGLSIQALEELEAEEAVAALAALPGIGPWTAECYLLFCAGHPDIFPAGDLALQIAVARGIGLPERAREKALREIAAQWSPWRAVAARLFWAYYRAQRDIEKAGAAGLLQGSQPVESPGRARPIRGNSSDRRRSRP